MVLMLVVMQRDTRPFSTRWSALLVDNQDLNDSQQQVRAATDGLAKRLRNLASPGDIRVCHLWTGSRSNMPKRDDLVFRSVKSDGHFQRRQPREHCSATDTASPPTASSTCSARLGRALRPPRRRSRPALMRAGRRRASSPKMW